MRYRGVVRCCLVYDTGTFCIFMPVETGTLGGKVWVCITAAVGESASVRLTTLVQQNWLLQR